MKVLVLVKEEKQIQHHKVVKPHITLQLKDKLLNVLQLIVVLDVPGIIKELNLQHLVLNKQLLLVLLIHVLQQLKLPVLLLLLPPVHGFKMHKLMLLNVFWLLVLNIVELVSQHLEQLPKLLLL